MSSIVLTNNEFYNIASTIAETSVKISSGEIATTKAFTYTILKIIETIKADAKNLGDQLKFARIEEYDVYQGAVKSIVQRHTSNEINEEIATAELEALVETNKELLEDVKKHSAEVKVLMELTTTFPTIAYSIIPDDYPYVQAIFKIIKEDK